MEQVVGIPRMVVTVDPVAVLVAMVQELVVQLQLAVTLVVLPLAVEPVVAVVLVLLAEQEVLLMAVTV